MSVLTDIKGLSTNPVLQEMLRLGLDEVGPVASRAAAAEAVKLLVLADAGVEDARKALDGFEAANPAVVDAVGGIQAACAGVIAMPSEGQAIAMLHHMVDVARLQIPKLFPGAAA